MRIHMTRQDLSLGEFQIELADQSFRIAIKWPQRSIRKRRGES
jgi:hypothetical protein